MSVIVAGTLDTKGDEYEYVCRLVEAAGLQPLLIDCGVRAAAGGPRPDIGPADVAAAGGRSLQEVRDAPDRSTALRWMSEGLRAVVAGLRDDGSTDGAFGMGGSGAITLLAPAFRELPLGVPKMIATTMASGDTRSFVGASDLLLVPSIVDISGLNAISSPVLARCVSMLAAQLRHPFVRGAAPLVGASMFGVTTVGVTAMREALEAAGVDVLVFHANGIGGLGLEGVAGQGWLQGVCDLTTTELADHLLGGVASAGPDRLTSAGRLGTPQVVSLGALDIVNFGRRETVPDRFAGRRLYQHNETATLMRTAPEDMAALGTALGERLAAARGPVRLLVPHGGLSSLSEPGGPFHWPEADALLEAAVVGACGEAVSVEHLDAPVNSAAFGQAAAAATLRALQERT